MVIRLAIGELHQMHNMPESCEWGSEVTGEDHCKKWKCLWKTAHYKIYLPLSGTFTHRTIDIKDVSERLAAERNPIRFTTVLHVWVSIGSAYFIVITQMSEKRDIFTHHPRGDEASFLKKRKQGRRLEDEKRSQKKKTKKQSDWEQNGCQVKIQHLEGYRWKWGSARAEKRRMSMLRS